MPNRIANRIPRPLAAALALAALGAPLAAQTSGAAPAPFEVGARAPDFTLPSATAKGVGQPLHLSDLRGQTVVVAFFYKARTKG